MTILRFMEKNLLIRKPSDVFPPAGHLRSMFAVHLPNRILFFALHRLKAAGWAGIPWPIVITDFCVGPTIHGRQTRCATRGMCTGRQEIALWFILVQKAAYVLKK